MISYVISAYVYAIKVDGVARYIGKGMDGRVESHMAEAARINKRHAAGLPLLPKQKWHLQLAQAVRRGAKVDLKRRRTWLTEDEAKRVETETITRIRGRSPGQLWNCEHGVPSAYEPDPPTRVRLTMVDAGRWLTVYSAGLEVGRIEPRGKRFLFWFFPVCGKTPPASGYAQTLDAAKAECRRAWRRWRAWAKLSES
jgi:hypothetical protein